MSNMLELADRVEALTGADREVFEAAYAACNGGRLFEQPASDGFQKTFAKWERFRRFLDAEAWLDAAMMLVPEGWRWMAGHREHPHGRAYVENGKPAFDGIGTRRNPERLWFEVNAATPALALCAAALRARRAVEGEK